MPKIGSARDRILARAAALEEEKKKDTSIPKIKQMSTAEQRIKQRAAQLEYERQLPNAIRKAQETYIKTNTGSREQEERAKSPIQEPVRIPSVSITQNGNRRFQTVAERAENKPTSTNVRAKGNSGKESTSRVGKAAQSIGLNTVGSVQMMGDTLEKAGENAEAYQQDSGLKDRADKALNDIKLARTLYGEDSEQYRQANAAYEAIRQEIVDYQNAPDKAVSKDSRGYQTMLKAQQLQQEALEGTSGVGRFLGETAFSVADNLATVIASGGNPMLAATMMGVKAAAGKAMELTDAGVNASSAFTRGAFSGAIEAATEKIPVDNLMDLVKAGGKNLLVNVLKQAGVEGTEEGFSYLFNYLADKLAQDPNAQFNPNDLLKQIASGAVSGLVFGAGGTAVNAMGVQQTEADPVMEQAVQMLQQKMGAMQAPAVQEMARPAANEVQAMQTPAAVQTPAAAPVRNAQEMSEDRKRVSEYAAALGENGSKALTAAYSSESVSGKYKPEEIVHGFYNAYNQSMTGKKLNAEGQKRVAALPETVRYMAESAGAEDARRAKQATYFGENAKLVRDDNWKQANLSYKTSRNLDSLAKVLGVKIRFTDKIVVDTDGNEANAQYQNGEIVISRNTELPVMTAAIHESVHRLREVSPEAYTELSSFVMEHMSELGKNFNLDYRAALYQTQNRDVLTEEMIADAYGVMLESSDVLEQFARKHTTVLQRLADGIRDILRKIKNATSLEDLKLDKAEKDAFFELQDQMNGMERAMRNALKAVEAQKTAEAQKSDGEATKNATQKGDVKASANRQNPGYNAFRDVYAKKGLDALSEKLGDLFPLSANFESAISNDTTKLSNVSIKANSTVKQPKENFFAAARRIVQTHYPKGSEIPISQIDVKAKIGLNFAEESIAKAKSNTERQTILDIIPYVSDLLPGSRLLAVEKVQHTDNKKTSLFCYRLYNAYKRTETDVSGNTVVRQHAVVFTVVQNLEDAGAYLVTDIKSIAPDRARIADNSKSLHTQGDASIDTVAELYEIVKGIPRNDGGLAYTDTQKLAYLFNYTERADGTKYSLKTVDETATYEENGKKYSIKSLRHDIAEGKMLDDLVTAKVFTTKEAKLLRENLDKLISYILPNAHILDMNESYTKDTRPFSTYKPNSDPLYGISLDFSTLCRKRLMTQYVIEQLQLKENRPMSAEEQIAIRSMLLDYRRQEKALQVACAMCYVEAARLKAPKQMEAFFNNTEDIMRKHFAKKDKAFNDKVKAAQTKFKVEHGYEADATKKDMTGKDTKALNEMSAKMRKGYKPNAEQQAIIDKAKSLPRSTFLTAANLTALSIDHPEIYSAYTDHIRASTRSKSLEGDVPYYYGDSRGPVSDSFIESVNAENGMRFDSWSDFQMKHMLDMITAVIDLSVRKSKMHGYTKFPEMVRIFGKTGMMFNLSGVTEGNGFDADGNLLFSDTEGIDINEAIKLRKQFPETAGLQCIGVSDDHIRALLKSEHIDYVIPYHTSGMNATLRRMAGIHAWKDYTSTQHARKDPNAKKPANADKWQVEPVWSEFYVADGKDGYDIMEKTAQRYIDMCHERGLIPKFDQFIGEGYWKLLVDRKMINQKTGQIIEQQPVKPIFDFDLINREIDNEVSKYDPALEQRALKYVVDNFDAVHQRIKDLKKGHPKKSMLNMANQILQAYAEGSKREEKHSRSNRELLNNMIRQYGAIEPGENPFRSVSVPKQTEEGKNVSKTVRTIMEAEATPEAMLPDVEALVADGTLSFESYTDEQAIADAAAKLKDKGWAKAYAQWEKDITRGVVSKENTVAGWTLYNNAANSGDTAMALDILQKMVGHQRNAAQALQATRVLKKLSPETQLYGVQRSVQDLQDELNERYGVEGAPQLKVDETLAEEFMQAQTEEERDEALQKIYRDIGKQMPSRFVDKWDAWRYLAMLGNPRTHVRNIVGNAGFAPLVATKNLTATAIESAVNRVTGGKVGRTKALVLGGKNSRALLQAAWEDYAKVASVVAGEGKYSDLQKMNKAIDEGRKIFKNKALEAARKANSAAMEAEDAWFSKPHYAAALASYCKANGIKPEQIAKGGKVVDRARAYAIKEAQKATYRDTNMLSEMFGKIGGKWRYNKRNPLERGVGTLIEGVLPFRKTPANILARGVEYSPIGLANGIKKAVWDVQKGNATAAEAIDNISAGLTGTGLMLLGVYLAAQGLVRGRGEEDEKEREFAELQGHQAYSMELPNGTSVTLDWLAPQALPFFVGVTFWEMTDGATEKSNMDSIVTAVTSVTEPMLELSCLQSLNDLIESVSYAKNNDLNSFVAMIVSAATSYLTQALPTLGGQIERSAQKERMTTYTDKNKWISKDLQYTLGSASARVPGVDYNQIPYIDAWGRTESTGTTAGNAFNNFLNPSYTNKIETSAMEEELLRLYHATAEGTFPTGNVRYVGSGDNRKHLTAEEYVQYNTEKGQTAYSLLEDLTNSKLYEAANDEQKLELVGDVYTYANQIARAGVQEEYTPDKWVQAARNAESVGMSETEYFLYRLVLEMVDTNNSVSQEDAQNAINKMSGLNKKQKSYLWQSTNSGWKKDNNPWK